MKFQNQVLIVMEYIGKPVFSEGNDSFKADEITITLKVKSVK